MAVSIAIILGSLWGLVVGPGPWWSLGFAALLCALGRRVPWAGWVGWALAASVLAGPTPRLPLADGDGVHLVGTVSRAACDEARCRLGLVDAEVDGRSLPGEVAVGASRVLLDPVRAGDRVRLEADLRRSRAGANPGVAWADAPTPERWWARAVGPIELVQARVSPALAWRAGLIERVRFDRPELTALYRAMVLGDRSDLRDPERDAFVDTGTAHLLAVSGLHLAVVGLGLHRLLTWLLLWLAPGLAQVGRPRAWAALAALALVWAYVLVLGRSQATYRAAVFLTLWLGGLALGRRPTGWRTLLVAAAALTLADPAAPLGPSFQLSFAAAGALVAAAATLRRVDAWLAQPGRMPTPSHTRLVRALWPVAATTLVCFVATAPLALAWFGQLAPIGLAVNLVAVPLVALLVVPVGFAWLGLALVWPAAASILAVAPELLGGWLLDLVDGWAQLAGSSQVATWPHIAGVLGAVAVVALLVGRRLRAVGAVLLVVTGVLVAWPPPAGLTVTALDVGHGDAVLVQPPGGGALLFDAGGASGGRGRDDRSRLVARWTVIPALARLGVARLDALVITHPDQDHVGGAVALARRIPIRELWLGACAAPHPTVQRLAATVLARGGAVRVLYRGPPVSWQGAALQVLWPREGVLGPSGRCRLRRNDASVVLRIAYAGRAALLTGDVHRGAEAALLEDGVPLRADILKVAHHGSRTSSSPAVLDAVRPRVALVSGRARPGRMPPHLEVVTRLQRRGVRVGWTGRDGAVTVRVRADGALQASGMALSGGPASAHRRAHID